MPQGRSPDQASPKSPVSGPMARPREASGEHLTMGTTESVPDHRPMKERQRRCRCYLRTGERPGRGMG
jgi:hypothetical protein